MKVVEIKTEGMKAPIYEKVDSTLGMSISKALEASGAGIIVTMIVREMGPHEYELKRKESLYTPAY